MSSWKASALFWGDGEELRSRRADKVFETADGDLIASGGELNELAELLGGEGGDDLPEELMMGCGCDGGVSKLPF